MEQQKKPWVKPEISFIPADSPKYKQIQAALETEAKQHLQMSLNGRMHLRNLLQIVVGGSGAGKSRYVVLPNLMLANALEAKAREYQPKLIIAGASSYT